MFERPEFKTGLQPFGNRVHSFLTTGSIPLLHPKHTQKKTKKERGWRGEEEDVEEDEGGEEVC